MVLEVVCIFVLGNLGLWKDVLTNVKKILGIAKIV